MDGLTLLRDLRIALQEPSGGTWLDTRYSYDCLYSAAIATAERTNIFTSSQAITTAVSDATYTLNGDFLKLYLMDDQNRRFIKYVAGTSTYFIYESSYDSIYLQNNTTAVLIPSSFIIRDASAITQITGTTSSAGALTNGTTALNKTGETFITKGVTPGDLVHNTTDSSSGVVVTVDSEIKLTCCLFDGTDNYFDNADAYIINPQGRFQIVLDPLPSTAGHTVTIPYVQRPDPVYSSYYRYRFPFDWRDLLVSYAAWKYKYRDREPDFGDRLYKFWDARVRQVGHASNEVQRRTRFNVNLNKSAGSSNTWR